MFSFGTSSRFGGNKTKYNTEFNSPMGTTLSKTGAGFGYGTKMDLTKNGQISQSSFGAYTQKGYFEQNVDKRRGYDFGTPRQKMTNTLRNNLSPDKMLKVGPGDYDVLEKFKNDSRFSKAPTGFSGWKTKRFSADLKSTPMITPGPQHYSNSLLEFKPDGKEFYSKFKSSGSGKIAPIQHGASRSQSLASLIIKNPGPGQYEIPECISKDGKYAESNKHASPSNAFSKSVRKGLTPRDNFPGPGSYKPCTTTEFIKEK